MDRRSFLKGLAAAVGVAALPEFVAEVAPRSAWSPDRLVCFSAQGTALEARPVLARVLRAGDPVLAFHLNALGGAFRWVPELRPDMCPVGSDLEIECGEGAMAAGVFRRPNGSYYVKTAGA